MLGLHIPPSGMYTEDMAVLVEQSEHGSFLPAGGTQTHGSSCKSTRRECRISLTISRGVAPSQHTIIQARYKRESLLTINQPHIRETQSMLLLHKRDQLSSLMLCFSQE